MAAVARDLFPDQVLAPAQKVARGGVTIQAGDLLTILTEPHTEAAVRRLMETAAPESQAGSAAEPPRGSGDVP